MSNRGLGPTVNGDEERHRSKITKLYRNPVKVTLGTEVKDTTTHLMDIEYNFVI